MRDRVPQRKEYRLATDSGSRRVNWESHCEWELNHTRNIWAKGRMDTLASRKVIKLRERRGTMFFSYASNKVTHGKYIYGVRCTPIVEG